LFREILRLDGYAEFILAHRFSNSKCAARVRTLCGRRSGAVSANLRERQVTHSA
jgi:hypothetical protein